MAVGKGAGRVAVAGEDGGAVAVFVAVDEIGGLVVAARAHHAEHRPEDFVLCRWSCPGHAVEQRAAEEEAALVALQLKPAPVDDQLGAFAHALADETLDAALGLCGDRPAPSRTLGRWQGRPSSCGSWAPAPRPDGLAVFSPTGTATEIAMQRSPAEPKPAPISASTAWSMSASGMTIMWFLAPPSACTRLPAAVPRAIDVLGDRRRADEAHRLDVGMVEDRVDGFLVAVDDVEHAGREAGLLEQLARSASMPRDRAPTA